MTTQAAEFVRIVMKQVPDQFEDELTQICFEFGATGVAEDLSFTQTSLRYQPDVVEKPFHDLNVYFNELPSEDFFLRVQSLIPGLQIEKNIEVNKDWLSEWKKGFKPFLLAGDFWVVPTWCETPGEAKKVISIDPGMAFGTGTHATTQLAAELLLDSAPHVANEFSLIDVGTGTGILAMLAKLCGAGRVVATEIDPEARAVAIENCQANHLDEIYVSHDQVESIEEKFSLVMANIIDGILLDLKPHLLNRMAANGFLILTGILQEREADFTREFLTGTSLQVLRREVKDEWVGLLLKSQ